MEKDENKDVHTEHCCQRHGCKYGDIKCTVFHYEFDDNDKLTGKVIYEKQQSFPCSVCGFTIEDEWDLIVYTNEVYDIGNNAGWKRGVEQASQISWFKP